MDQVIGMIGRLSTTYGIWAETHEPADPQYQAIRESLLGAVEEGAMNWPIERALFYDMVEVTEKNQGDGRCILPELMAQITRDREQLVTLTASSRSKCAAAR